LDPKKRFLLDATGGVVSALLLGGVLTRFKTIIGMPREILSFLLAMACMYAIYLFVCYWRFNEDWKPYMKVIVLANLCYCCLTTGLVVYFRQELTTLGFIYFLLEVVVILALVSAKWRTVVK
jgi:hypothetical protein